MATKETRTLSNAGDRLANIIDGAPDATMLHAQHGNRTSYALGFTTIELPNGKKLAHITSANAFLSSDKSDYSDHFRIESVAVTADQLRAMLAAIES